MSQLESLLMGCVPVVLAELVQGVRLWLKARARPWVDGWNRVGGQTKFYGRTLRSTVIAVTQYRVELIRLIAQIRILDRRMKLVSRAIFLAVLSAILTCAVVVLLFATGLTGVSFGTPIAILFIATMVATGAGFFVFLIETRLGARAVRISSDILQHEAGTDDD